MKTVRVSKRIKPIPCKKRIRVPLILDDYYYVCFGNNKAQPCKLIEIDKPEECNQWGGITIEILCPKNKHHLFADEIGRTPEEAVMNEVTF